MSSKRVLKMLNQLESNLKEIKEGITRAVHLLSTHELPEEVRIKGALKLLAGSSEDDPVIPYAHLYRDNLASTPCCMCPHLLQGGEYIPVGCTHGGIEYKFKRGSDGGLINTTTACRFFDRED